MEMTFPITWGGRGKGAEGEHGGMGIGGGVNVGQVWKLERESVGEGSSEKGEETNLEDNTRQTYEGECRKGEDNKGA